MSYQFKDIDIEEVWSDEEATNLHINFNCSKAGTSFTRADLLRMLAIVDGTENGEHKK